MRPISERRSTLRIELKILEEREKEIKAGRAEIDRLVKGAEEQKRQIPAGAEGRLYVLNAQAKRGGGRLLDAEAEAERQNLRETVEGPDRTVARLEREGRLIDGQLAVTQSSLVSIRQELAAQDKAQAEEGAAELKEAKAAVADGRATARQQAIAKGGYDSAKTGPGGFGSVTF